MRRFGAWLFLVYYEVEKTQAGQEAFATEIGEFRAQINDRLTQLRADLCERDDLVIQELWKRTDSTLARYQMEIEKLHDEVRSLKELTSTVLLRLSDSRVYEPAPNGSSASNGSARVSEDRSSQTTMPGDDSNFQTQVAVEIIPSLKRRVGYFTTSGRILDLACGSGEFLEYAQWSGLNVYGVDDDPDALRRCSSLGLETLCENPLDHLRSIPSASLAGVHASRLVDLLPSDQLPLLLAEISRVLVPRGVCVFETSSAVGESIVKAARLSGLVTETFVLDSLGPVLSKIEQLPDQQSAFDSNGSNGSLKTNKPAWTNSVVAVKSG